MRAPNIILFTDLDGTLLDHYSYSWASAREALEGIARRGVPLVFCTSKTRAEVEVLRRKMGNGHPFITENGGGIFVPRGYFPQRVARELAQDIGGAVSVGHQYSCLALARPYAEVVAALQQIAADTRVGVVGFHQMTAREVAQNTGLTLREAELARQRDFSEPFFFAGGGAAEERRFAAAAKRRGLSAAQGGRFWHLFAGSDKGRAVRKLIGLYRQALRRGRVRTAALGDSANDLPMLEAADRAVLIPKPGGKIDEVLLLRLPRAVKAPLAGPAGWNKVVLELLGGE